jgi:hypothetical protein
MQSIFWQKAEKQEVKYIKRIRPYATDDCGLSVNSSRAQGPQEARESPSSALGWLQWSARY